MKKKYLILTIYFTSFHISGNLIAQALDSINVPIYQICNQDLECVIDSFIQNEKQYDYYDANVVLYANVMNYDGTSLQLYSGSKRGYKVSIYSYLKGSNLGDLK